MKIIYTAPNRSHHYRYAAALEKGGLLYKFVAGFSRFSSKAALPEVGNKLVRADILQNVFLASLKFRLPKFISGYLAYLAKIEQDFVSRRYIKNADIFVFYNGSGLSSCKRAIKTNTITVVEAVNSHVDYQEKLLKEEYRALNLPWQPFQQAEKERRIKEYELADYILLPSEFVRQSFIEYGFKPEKLIKVPFGFTQLGISQGERIKVRKPGDAVTILYVGSVSVRKGLIYLIEAFRDLDYANKKLVIVGPKAHVTGLENIEIPEGVEFTGTLKGADLENAYKSADIFCLPTIEEGLALVLGEALSYGIPIVTTVNSGASDLFDDNKEGFILPIRNSRALQEKMQLLVNDTELYNSMHIAAVKKSSELNGWEETGRLLCSKLTQLPKK